MALPPPAGILVNVRSTEVPSAFAVAVRDPELSVTPVIVYTVSACWLLRGIVTDWLSPV